MTKRKTYVITRHTDIDGEHKVDIYAYGPLAKLKSELAQKQQSVNTTYTIMTQDEAEEAGVDLDYFP